MADTVRVAANGAAPVAVPLGASAYEIHSAAVFFFGERVYKVKKPVDLGFLDVTTRQARRMVCYREVELNRRLAPDVYRGVAEVADPEGVPCEWMVVMRRMPEDRPLSSLVRSDSAVDDQLRALARMLAVFRTKADRGPAIDEAGSIASVRARWMANFAELESFRGNPLAPEVLDELADRALRYLDGLDDAAYTGTRRVPSLDHHHIAYRAVVRAKVSSVRHAQDVSDAAEQDRSLANLALDHLRVGEPQLILVGGLPGTGKSTVAGGLADELNAVLLRSDRVRKENEGHDPDSSAAEEWGEGLYGPDATLRTYETMLGRARGLLAVGESVVLDASWNDAARRGAARQLSAAAPILVIELQGFAPSAQATMIGFTAAVPEVLAHAADAVRRRALTPTGVRGHRTHATAPTEEDG